MDSKILRGLLWAAAAAFACPAPASAVASGPVFTQEKTVLVSSMSVQSVVPFDGKFRMYLTSAPFWVLSATSTDQVNWSLEAGLRLSSVSAGSLSASSITAVGVVLTTNAVTLWRMYFTAIDDQGLYRVLSATSADGLAWSKEPGTRLTNNLGSGFIGGLSPFQASNTALRLYYVADQNGTNVKSRFRVHSASSTDGGVTWLPEGALLSSINAYAVSAATVTGGDNRLYYTIPLAGTTTAYQVLSAKASDGLSFTQEDGVRLSTDANASSFGGLVVLRSTESFRWRMFTDYRVEGTTQTFVSHALTRIPLVNTWTPPAVKKGEAGVAYSLTGEVFAPTCTVGFTLGGSTFAATTVVGTNDVSRTGTLSAAGVYQGFYGAAVTNPDGMSGTLAGALEVQLPPGSVSVVDNLMRPLKGEKAKISVVIFEAGVVTLRLFTVDGGFVATVFQGTMPVGTTTVPWDGRTGSGNVVSSGVYLLSAKGPRLNEVTKIVVVK